MPVSCDPCTMANPKEYCSKDHSGGRLEGGGSSDPCDSANPPDYCETSFYNFKNDFTANIDTTNLVCDGDYSGSENEKLTKKAWRASSVPTYGRLETTNYALDHIARRERPVQQMLRKAGSYCGNTVCDIILTALLKKAEKEVQVSGHC